MLLAVEIRGGTSARISFRPEKCFFNELVDLFGPDGGRQHALRDKVVTVLP